MSYGPNSVQNYKYSESLRLYQKMCISYISKLSPFDKYCVWRYTIGSASVNHLLIFNKLSDNSPRWTYLFFLFYHNTYGNKYLPSDFRLYEQYFINPKSYNNSPDKLFIAETIIRFYIKRLEYIIFNSPSTPGDFNVFKVSSKYPGLPDKNNELPVDVLQLPFNSTTINPYFNYAPFINPDATCCLFNILIPKGSKCLYVPSEYHAYPFEQEIILPPGSTLNVFDIKISILNYIDPKTVNIIKLSDEKDIVMGNVYVLDEYFPCGQSQCRIQKRRFTTYICSFSNQ